MSVTPQCSITLRAPIPNDVYISKSVATLLAAVFISGPTWIYCYSMKLTTLLQNLFMVTKVVVLMLVILVGIYALSQGMSLSRHPNAGAAEPNVQSAQLRIHFLSFK